MNVGGCGVARRRKLGRCEVCWWGWNRELWRWRWNGTHIDVGPVSVYELPEKGPRRWFWRFVSVLIKPMRWRYHRQIDHDRNRTVLERLKNRSRWNDANRPRPRRST